MISQLRTTVLKITLGLLLVSLVATACNDGGKEKKDDKMEDTAKKMDPPPALPKDTSAMDKDTADTRPVKPGE